MIRNNIRTTEKAQQLIEDLVAVVKEVDSGASFLTLRVRSSKKSWRSLQKSLKIFEEKFNVFWRKIWRFFREI